MIIKVLQGMAIGLAFVLPGLSAGTVMLILGFYRRLIEDLARFNLAPYIPHLFGAAIGVLGGVKVIGYLMEHYSTLLGAFLLGMLLASLQAVLNHNGKIKPAPLPLAIGLIAFVVTWFFLCEPAADFAATGSTTLLQFLFGGMVASATMLLPGISGSAMLIIMNIYADVLEAVNHWQWLNLAVFGTGAAVGLFGLARLLAALYRRYSDAVSCALAGMILGSTRVLLPDRISMGVILAIAAGALLVLYCSTPRKGRLP